MENINLHTKVYFKTEAKNNQNFKNIFNKDLTKLKSHLKKVKKTLSQDKSWITDFKRKLFRFNEINRHKSAKKNRTNTDDDLVSSLVIKNYKTDKTVPAPKKYKTTLANKITFLKKNNGYNNINNYISAKQLNSQNNTEKNYSQRKKTKNNFFKIVLKDEAENEKNPKNSLFLLPILKSKKYKSYFKMGESVESFSEKLFSKKLNNKNSTKGFSFEKKPKNNISINRYYENNAEENDMKPNVRFKNLKKELHDETSKINKMFAGFNKEISKEEFLIRVIYNKMSNKRKKEKSNANSKKYKIFNS